MSVTCNLNHNFFVGHPVPALSGISKIRVDLCSYFDQSLCLTFMSSSQEWSPLSSLSLSVKLCLSSCTLSCTLHVSEGLGMMGTKWFGRQSSRCSRSVSPALYQSSFTSGRLRLSSFVQSVGASLMFAASAYSLLIKPDPRSLGVQSCILIFRMSAAACTWRDDAQDPLKRDIIIQEVLS